ncbi:MAG: hypothetical protein GTO71_10665 [Woeseiaceae bacterium]|nr:hypothetical protein [Woeseiaceae bacterium]NIP21536.1 hypothetical protein [Woeseiaceae bacterium]NIS90524.1 hypothetical protein [Woeseiaceae bacterium]
MCLVVLAFRVSADAPIIVAANRDEFHARPARDAGWWPEDPAIIAGRDLQAGGTWLGVHRSGRVAMVTNYRDAEPSSGAFESRGRLVADFLQGTENPLDYLAVIDTDAFAGFNLVVSDGETLAYLSNRGGGLRELPAGIYGLSNATLDTPWEKVERSKSQLAGLIDDGAIDDESLLRLLGDREKGPVEEALDDRLPFATAHAITAPFIITPEYGTRCSTVVRTDESGHWHFLERRFDAKGDTTGESRFSFGGIEDGQ